jgi:predicted membrane protein
MAMDKRGQQVIAYSLIGLGILFLGANFLNIDPGRIIWPLVLVVLGILLVTRPQLFNPPEDVRYGFAGSMVLDENWPVEDKEIRLFAGDVLIDLGKAEFPDGETALAVRFFAGSIDVRLPAGVGLMVTGNAFVIDSDINGEKHDHFFNGLRYLSPGYDEAEKRVRLDISCFACDFDLVQI